MTDRISQLFTICQQSYLRYNIRIKLPEHTDPVKTYQWRYLTSLDRKFAQWKFNDDLAKKFIDVSVDYCSENRLFKKGLSVFHQTNLMEVCYNRLMAESKTQDMDLEVLRSTHNWLRSLAGQNPMAYLLGRDNPWGYCNITKWHLASKIPTMYLAMSQVCKQALLKLHSQNNIERRLLPAQTKLFLLYHESALRQTNLSFLNSW